MRANTLYNPLLIDNTAVCGSFGMMIKSREFVGFDSYKYGFNGKENDNEVKGSGDQQDYGFRIYDSRLGRFLSIDPITKIYPFLTPYQFSSNNPIANIDLDGLEGAGNTGAPTTTSVPISDIPSGRVSKDPVIAPAPIDLSTNPTPQQVFDKFSEVVSYAAETSGRFTTGDYFLNIDPTNQVTDQVTANNTSALFTFGLNASDVVDVISSPVVSSFAMVNLNQIEVSNINNAPAPTQGSVQNIVANSTSQLFLSISFNSVTAGSTNSASLIALNLYTMGVNNSVVGSNKEGTKLIRGFENQINSSIFAGDITQKHLENRATFPNNAAAPPRTNNRNIRISFNTVLIGMQGSSPGFQNTGIKLEY